MKTANTIVIAHPMHLGDVVTALPIAGALKQAIPTARIHFIGTAYTRPLLDACAHVDEFLDFDQVLADPTLLSQVEADVFINPYPHYGLARVAARAGIPCRIGNLRRPRSIPYCNRFVSYGRAHSQDHTVTINLKTLQALGIQVGSERNDLQPLYGLVRTLTLSETLQSQRDRQRFNLVLHPKSGGEGREWPLAHFAALIRSLPMDRFNIFLTGTAAEREWVYRHNPSLLQNVDVVDLMGQLQLSEFIAFLRTMDGIVASGTGPVHIGAAVGLHALGIFPPTININAMRWAPVGPRAEFLEQSACPKSQARVCSMQPLGPPCACTAAVKPEQVRERLLKWLPLPCETSFALSARRSLTI